MTKPRGARVIPTAFSPALAGAREVVALVTRMADSQRRDDLVAELAAVTNDLAVESVPVVVIGGAGQGKSSVINALVGAPVSPVSPSRATAVPIDISHGTNYSAEVTTEPYEGRGPLEVEARVMPFGDASALSSHQYNPDNERHLRLVTVTAPSSALSRGLVLIDTPPIADAWSGPAPRLLRAAAGAAAVILVSSAADVLAGGELDLLRVTSSLCSRQIVVINGTNRYPEWASVVERDELLLEQRGISADVFAVDPTAYWADTGGLPPGPDPGMQSLAGHLESAVVLDSEQLRISRALTETFWVADRLKMRLSAERAVIDNVTRTDVALGRLRAAAQAAHDLCGPSAGWLALLHQRLAGLRADLDTDLEADLAGLRTEAGELAATAARSGGWDEAFAAIHRRVADIVAYRQRVLRFAIRACSREVTETFHTEWSEIIAATEISPEAHALVAPRLTRVALSGPRTLADIELWPDSADLPPPPMPGVPETMAAWLMSAEQLIRHEMDSALTRAGHEIETRCGVRSLELHRSLVEVLTSLNLLGQLDSSAVTQRRRSLASDLEQLHTMDWRVS